MRLGWSTLLRIALSYFGERMESNSTNEKGIKRKDRQNFVQKLCVHTVNGQTNKPSQLNKMNKHFTHKK